MKVNPQNVFLVHYMNKFTDFLFQIYSVLRASTGSFLAAYLDGIIPEIRVRTMLITTRITAPATGRVAFSSVRFVIAWITALIGRVSRTDTPIQIIPEVSPTSRVSAL